MRTTRYVSLKSPILLPKNTSMGLFTPQATVHNYSILLASGVAVCAVPIAISPAQSAGHLPRLKRQSSLLAQHKPLQLCVRIDSKLLTTKAWIEASIMNKWRQRCHGKLYRGKLKYDDSLIYLAKTK